MPRLWTYLVTKHQGLYLLMCIFSGISCGDPGPIQNGRRLGGGLFTCDTTVTYTCDNCYEIQGSPALTCQPSGQWNVATPTCISKNDSIPEMHNICDCCVRDEN